MITSVWQDIAYALRGLRRAPVFTATAVITLALGIGANTAIFGLVEAVLLRTVPLTEPHRLFFIARGAGGQADRLSTYPYLERLRANTGVLEGVTAYSLETFRAAAVGITELTSGAFVSGNYHKVLGVRMALGRGFISEDDRAGTDALIGVISDNYWTRRFARDPDVLGRTIVVDDRTVTIIGVTAPGFQGLESGASIDITLPFALRALVDNTFLTSHESWQEVPIVARLKPGIDRTEAAAAVESVFQQYLSEPENQQFQRTRDNLPRSSRLLPANRGSADLRERYSALILVLMAIVAVVLLIGCVNVANLLLSRAAARERETAVRIALGAGRTRLVRQFLTESVLLAGMGGTVGFFIATWGSALIVSIFSIGENPLVLAVKPNQTVLAFTMAVSVLTGILFGLAPAFAATRANIASGTKGGTTTPSLRGRRAMVALQIALCTLLVTVAGLLVRTLQNLEEQGGSFDHAKVLMASLSVDNTLLPPERLPQFCNDLIGRLKQNGAVSGSCSTLTPIDLRRNIRALTIPGVSSLPQPPDAFANQVTADYFQIFGIQLVHGRLLTTNDSAASQKVALINESMEREYFGAGSAIGRTIHFGSREPGVPFTIVGIVQDTFQRSFREAPPRMIYMPIGQDIRPPRTLTAALRTTGKASALASSVYPNAAAIDKDVVVSHVRTMEQQIDGAVMRERAMAMFSVWFGVLALVLAGVGLYGVLAYEVAQRTRETGIRLALGADPARLMRDVLERSCVVAGAGILVGLAVSVATTWVLSSFLFGLSARDPFTLIAAAAILGLAAIVAGYIPARKAARTDAVLMLRSE